jgi:Domain of unknown function (DUF4412)
VIAAAAFALALAAEGTTGLYFEQTTVVRQAGMTAGAGVRTRVFCAEKRLRLEAGDAPGGPALLLRLDEGRVFRLDPDSKLATEIDASLLRSRSQSEAAVAAGLMGGPEQELRERPLEGRRTVAGYSCRGFRLTSPSVSIDVWVAETLPVRSDVFADFLEWSGAEQALGGLVAAIRRLPGFPLETRTRVSVLGEMQETVSTVTAVRVGPQPMARFEIPRGWRVVKATSPPQEAPR